MTHVNETARNTMDQINNKMKRTMRRVLSCNDVKVAEKCTLVPALVIGLEYIVMMLALNQLAFSAAGITIAGDKFIDVFTGLNYAFAWAGEVFDYIFYMAIWTAVLVFYLMYKKLNTEEGAKQRYVFKKNRLYWGSAVITAAYYSWKMLFVNNSLLNQFGTTNIRMGANMFTGFAVLIVNWLVFIVVFVALVYVTKLIMTKLKNSDVK